MVLTFVQLTTLALLSLSVGAIPPPPDQVSANCLEPTYASDSLVCGDDELRELDHLLLERISTDRGTRSAEAGFESHEDWFRRSRLCAFEAAHSDCLLAAYCWRLALLAGANAEGIPACSVIPGEYVAAHSFSRSGFASNSAELRRLVGREVLVRGFVDHRNLHGDEGAREILGDWWGGYGPSEDFWGFGLKAESADPAGHSFTVLVPNDLLRDDLLRLFLVDARAGRPTTVYLRGRISTFNAPMNLVSKTGLRMKVDSSVNIHPIR